MNNYSGYADDLEKHQKAIADILYNANGTASGAVDVYEYILSEWINLKQDQAILEYKISDRPISEGSYYYDLFKFFSDRHNLTLLDGEIEEILCVLAHFEREWHIKI